MSSPPIIINSNPHLDFSQLNNSLLLHTANTSCQTSLSSPSKYQKTHQYPSLPVVQKKELTFKENHNRPNSLISHYLPSVVTSASPPSKQIRAPFVEYTVGHLQVYNQQPRAHSLTPKTVITPKPEPIYQNASETKRQTVGCFGNSSPINALFNIICKENGLNNGVSLEENMNNVGSRAKQQQQKTNETTTAQKKQENGQSKAPSRVKTPQNGHNTPSDNMR